MSLGASVDFGPLATTLQTVFWTSVCNNGSMFNQLAYIVAKILFNYTEAMRKHILNQHAAASGRLLENAAAIAQTVFSYLNVYLYHVSYLNHFISRSSKTIWHTISLLLYRMEKVCHNIYKPFLGLGSIFPIKKQCLIKTQNSLKLIFSRTAKVASL